jgi:hypothetical protein
VSVKFQRIYEVLSSVPHDTLSASARRYDSAVFVCSDIYVPYFKFVVITVHIYNFWSPAMLLKIKKNFNCNVVHNTDFVINYYYCVVSYYYSLLFKDVYFKESLVKTVLPHVRHLAV